MSSCPARATAWFCLCLLAGSLATTLIARAADRATFFLDGPWQIGESVSPEVQPTDYTRTVMVPGLVNQARPGFRNVDRDASQDVLTNATRFESADVATSEPERNYFWHRRSFVAPTKRQRAILRVNKAQFGIAAWLNGKPVGEYPGCLSSGTFNVTDAMVMPGTNTLLLRIGAHPGVLPPSLPAGFDPEKRKWTPGIYDRISITYSDNPVIEWVQAAPNLEASEVQLQTKIRNYGTAMKFQLRQTIRPLRSGKAITNAPPILLQLKAGEERILHTKVRLTEPRLWSPQDPFLYAVDARTGGDSLTTRFAMREFRSDGATGRFLLNGKPIFLRGSNIALHRFFEDPLCENLPWNEGWVRRLLLDIPRQMNWNSVRFFLGPVPERWLELADEAGLLVQYGFPLGGDIPGSGLSHTDGYDLDPLIQQYGDWVRDHWNHPSVVIWSACDGMAPPILGNQVIPAVRKLDLSNRLWSNGANPPVSAEDPVDYRASLFRDGWQPGPMRFESSQLEAQLPKPDAWQLAQLNHPILLSQYGWLWLNRDGTPTLNASNVFATMLGPNAGVEDRFALNASLLAAETEFWRSTRRFAGVLHFPYLTSSHRNGRSSDPFRDLRTLRLDPRFLDYVGNAFKPLGVCLQYYQTELPAGEEAHLKVTVINDEDTTVSGRLQLTLETTNSLVKAQVATPFETPRGGKQELEVTLPIPAVSGRHILKAAAFPVADRPTQPTLSRRWVDITTKPR